MTKELFKLLVAEFQKLGINPTKWLGTRTNVKRIGKTNLSATPVNKFAIQREFDNQGVDRILKLFDEEARYLAQLTDMEGTQLLANLKTTNKIVKPTPVQEAGIYQFSKLPGKEITPAEYTGQKARDEAKIQSATLKASMETTKVDQDLAKKLNLDMSKAGDYDKLLAWKKEHGIPEFDSPEGIASLFKTVEDNPLADLGTHLDNIQKEGKSLADNLQKITDLAWKMSPEGQAAEEAIRKDILRRGSEGKGFAGGVFGERNDGYFRALVRPFLLDQHEKGIIKLSDSTLDSLKNSNDIKSGGGNDFMYPDPVRVFRQHYGDDAFDLIPDQETFGMGDTGYGPGRDRINEVMTEVIGKPILKVGPDNPGGYLTKGEYKAKLDHEDEVIGYIKNKEGRFGNMSEKELAEEIAGSNQRKSSIEVAMNIDYPPTGKTTDLTPEVSGIDDTLKSDFEVISGDSKKGKEISDALGITAKPGFPVTEAGKADLKVVKPKKKIDRPSIRLIKNFDQKLTDEGLAQEGYNLQEIGIIKRARDVMNTEGQNPDDALAWVRSEMADKAGVDIEEFMPDFDWGDFPGKDSFAQGGGVGSLFRKTDRARYSTGTEIGKEVAKYAGKTIGEIMEILKKNKKIRDLIEKTNKKLHETGIVKMWHEKTKLDKDSKIVAEKVLAPFVETVDKMAPWKSSSKSARNSTLAWFREELTNPKFKKVYHPHWGEGRTVYRGEKSQKNLEYSEKNPSNMFSHGENLDYMFNPKNVGAFASKDPSQAIKYATQAKGFPHVRKIHLDPIDFQEAVERNVIENPYGHTSDVILNAEQKAALKTDLLATGIATVKKYWPFSKGGSVSRQRRYENGISSMFRRV
jgi:hypothetical protein